MTATFAWPFKQVSDGGGDDDACGAVLEECPPVPRADSLSVAISGLEIEIALGHLAYFK